MAKITPIVVDFETKKIEKRPHYPPIPVGVSIKWPKDKVIKYYAWGHDTDNNTDIKNGRRAVLEAWTSGLPLLFHNSKFDVDVAETHLDCPRLDWELMHDSMFLVFLNNPHAVSFGLKQSALELLDMPPEEQDALRQWLIEHRPVIDGEKVTGKNFGAFISCAPGTLAGRYANGDVTRTLRLFDKLHPEIQARGMEGAYNRERRLMPILLDNERTGIRVDCEKLISDVELYRSALDKADAYIRKVLQAPNLNIDSDKELSDALFTKGVVTEWELTATGKRSTSKKTLTPDKFNDPRIAAALGYRGRLATCLGTFMEAWLEQAQASGGTINTTWNQVRQPKGGDAKGTRTGRPSTNDPNFLNIPKTFADRGDGYVHPAYLKVPELPLVRRYALPDKGCTWLHRDYNQQELRILAHFEDDQILRAYQDNPDIDLHTFVQDEIRRIANMEVARLPVKMMNFGKVYGEGLGSLAERLKLPIDEVKKIRGAQNRALPGLPALEKEVKRIAKSGGCVITWGGREYYVEPPKEVNGRFMSFEYKVLNYLIQGSAADCTKEALIRYNDAKKRGRFLVTVYDEINICAPEKAAAKEMAILRDCMEGIEFDIFMRSDGKSGHTWGDLKKYEEEKRNVRR